MRAAADPGQSDFFRESLLEREGDRIRAAREMEACPWSDWQIAREIEDDCVPWRIVGAFREDRWRAMPDEDLSEVREMLSQHGYRHPTTTGNWPDPPTPDWMIGQRIGATKTSPEGGVRIMHDRELRRRYARISRYLMPALNARLPAAIKRGRDVRELPSSFGPMLAESCIWWYEMHGSWPNIYDFAHADTLPPLDMLEDHGIEVDDLVRRADAILAHG